MPPAARITDPVSHPLPPVLGPGPGSPDCMIGFLPAWRAVPAAAAAAIQAAKQAADIAVQTAVAATAAAAGTPGAPAALAAEQTLKGSVLASMSSMMTGSGADIHACTTPSPVPPHGPGVVLQASATVMIDNLPAARQGDQVVEPLGPPNPIAMGCPTVVIGG
ncbi:MAG: PAAR domain-containing protein [Bryobacteraceae bacterium]